MTVLGFFVLIFFAFVFPWVFDRICMYISKKTTKHEYGIKDTYEHFHKELVKIERARKRRAFYETVQKFFRKLFGGK
jgi:membrane protein CcdC involved in cytochrome C biogenesis